MINNIFTTTREELYREIWEISLTGVAKKYNLNYSKLSNACKKYNIPYPTAAYWTKRNMGMDVKDEIIPLPKSDKKEIKLELKKSESLLVNNEERNEEKFIKKFNYLDFLDEKERTKVAKVIFKLDINEHKKFHKTICNYKNKIKDERREERQRNYYNPYYNIHNYTETGYFSNISKNEKERCMKIFSCIYYAIEGLGGKVNDDFSLQIRNELVTLSVEELESKVDHELTKEEARKLLEYEEDKKRGIYAYKPRIRKYDYECNGKLKITFESREYIRETDKVKLEDRLGDIIIKIYEKSERIKIEKIAREKEERRIEEERKMEDLLNKMKKEEAMKVIDLLNKSEDYKKACEIRNYINAVQSKKDLDEKTKKWIEWANKKADWIDPIIGVNDELLGRRNRGIDSKDKAEKLKKYASYYGWY